MFAYDSTNDVYNKISNIENLDSYNTFPNISPKLIVRRNSNISTRSSLRSSRSNIYFSRIVSKSGRLNIFIKKLQNKHLLYIRDLGNTLLTIRWRWILVTLCLANFLSFCLFGLLWMLLAKVSGDFDTDASDFCVANTKSFTGYFLLSVETIMTTGYGFRYPTEKCVQGWVLLAFQAFVSVAIQGALVSAVYVKISKPFTKDAHSLFSKKAVICLRDGKLCFIIRIIDLVGKVSAGTNITMHFVDKDLSQFDQNNCERDPFCIKQIKVEPHGFLIFPLEIVHVIDAESPFWTITPYQLLSKRIEVIVVAEGSSMVTGQLSQNKISYINSDVLWGRRFEPCVEFNYDKMKYIINYKKVNKTIPFDTPLCSAEELNNIERNLCANE